jgi:DNA replication and repair protein RecF
VAFQTISLTHLRNHRAQTFALAPRAQAFVGPNGVGKTSVLEAAHYLALARGFGHDRDALSHGEAYFQLDGVWVDPAGVESGDSGGGGGGRPLRVTCAYQAGRGRRVLYDGEALRRLAQHVGRIPVVAILPDDVHLVTGPAGDRRRWLDALLSQASAPYLEALLQYEHALAQLNALYQAAADTGAAPDPEQLELWEGPVVQYGLPLRQARAAFIGPFATRVQQLYVAVAATGAEPNEHVALHDTTCTGPALAAAWHTALRAERPRAAALGRLRWGPHRDDVGLELSGRPLGSTGSQGQLKTFVIALKLAQRAYLAQATGRPPLLLLDDVFERLDGQRAERLFALLGSDALSGGQVLLTDTDAARVQRALAAFGVAGTGLTALP